MRLAPHRWLGERGWPASIAHVLAFAAVIALLAWQFQLLEVTSDPDPDGYVTYAHHIQEHWWLMAHRRPPGYPLILALADLLTPASMHVDAFHVHLATIALLVLTSMLLINRLFGLAVAFVYGVLIAAPTNYVVWMGSIMLSDVFNTSFFWLAFFWPAAGSHWSARAAGYGLRCSGLSRVSVRRSTLPSTSVFLHAPSQPSSCGLRTICFDAAVLASSLAYAISRGSPSHRSFCFWRRRTKDPGSVVPSAFKRRSVRDV